MSAPLSGVRVLELAGLGPVPHAAMILADLGADVVLIERPNPKAIPGTPSGDGDVIQRGKRAVAADLRRPEDREAVLDLVARADALLEGYRPGAAERLGIGPDDCRARNPRLVYGRMTGWGQDGPMSGRAGHDINYLALTGVLNAIGRSGQPPTPPLNLVGDYGGGSMLLVIGVLAALWQRQQTGAGQVVDAAMVDGASLLAQMIWAFRATGGWTQDRGANLLDSGAPFYDTYATADGRYVAVGALEPAFYAELIGGLGLAGEPLPAQFDRAGWPELRRRFTEIFLTRTRDEWVSVFRDIDACVSPVLSFDEALKNEHILARGTLRSSHGIDQAAPAPRFSAAPRDVPPPLRRTELAEVMRSWQPPSA
jgi:alpha-methylacyl-CoA racemase